MWSHHNVVQFLQDVHKRHPIAHPLWRFKKCSLTHCGLVTPYGGREFLSGWTLAQVMACCLTAPSHYLNQCWLTISMVHWHSCESSFTRDTSAIDHKNQLKITHLKFTLNLPGANELINHMLCCCPQGRQGWVYVCMLCCIIFSRTSTMCK